MIAHNKNTDELIRELNDLPEEDFPLVAEFIEYLRTRRANLTSTQRTIAEIRAEAHRRAKQLNDLPRVEIVARFESIAESIRQEAVGKGTAIDGDWQSD